MSALLVVGALTGGADYKFWEGTSNALLIKYWFKHFATAFLSGS